MAFITQPQRLNAVISTIFYRPHVASADLIWKGKPTTERITRVWIARAVLEAGCLRAFSHTSSARPIPPLHSSSHAQENPSAPVDLPDPP